MPPLKPKHRAELRSPLEREIDSEGAEALLTMIPASDDQMPATKDFVRAEIEAGFRTQSRYLLIGGLSITGVILAAIAAATILGVLLIPPEQ